MCDGNTRVERNLKAANPEADGRDRLVLAGSGCVASGMIENQYHLIGRKGDSVRTADALGIIRPALANPWLTVLIDFLDEKDFPNHGLDVRALGGGQAVEPIA